MNSPQKPPPGELLYSTGGTMKLARFVLCSVTCLSILIPVSAAPSKRSTDHEENANRKEWLNYEKQLEDEDVLELKNLKSPKGSSSTSTTKVEKTFYTNAGGEKEENVQSTKQISNNGQLMERIRQNVHTKQEFGSSHPETRVVTEIEIPPKGIHKLYEEDVPRLRDPSKKNIETRYRYADNKKPDNVLQNINDVIRYQPEEMAEYIYETGDEKFVTNIIEAYLQRGVITREEALWYLQQIKALLSMVEEQEIRDKKQEQSRFYENIYSFPKGRMDMNQALLDLRDVQQLIQDKYMKQFPEDNNVNYRYDSDEAADSEETDAFKKEFERAEYQNLAEKLQNFDSLFSKASMEGVIYQLAKILFYQSFSMNGFEAQQPIKQFTTFLDGQVEEGHISRIMERKVFDILLSALTDTLDEHPELIGQNTDQNQKITKPQSDPLKDTIEKKSGKSKEPLYHATKSINLKSSGILDDPKKPDPEEMKVSSTSNLKY